VADAKNNFCLFTRVTSDWRYTSVKKLHQWFHFMSSCKTEELEAVQKIKFISLHDYKLQFDKKDVTSRHPDIQTSIQSKTAQTKLNRASAR
jgi:hypothetical protein